MSNKQRTIIITGGANGIGRNITEHYLEKGDNVVSLDINSEPLATLAKGSPQLLSLTCDITNIHDLTQSFQSIEETYGYANILINNAGVIHNEPLFSFFRQGNKRHDLESWHKVINVNLTAAFAVTNFFVEKLAMKRKPGVIINISSVSAKGTAGQSAYAASKAALNALTSTWAKELGSLNIRAISISPGYIDSAAMHAAVPEEIQKEILRKTALKKLGHADNIIQTINLAIENDFMTGNIIDIDGGYTN